MHCSHSASLAIIEYEILPGVEGLSGKVFYPAWNLLDEAKSRATQAAGTARGRGLWAIPTKSAQQTYLREYRKVKPPYHRALAAIAGKVRRGTISLAEGIKQAQDKMTEAYLKAYLKGMQAGGYRKFDIPKRDQDWVMSSVKEEMTFLRKWFKQISDPEKPMRFSLSKRAEMYAETLDHVFNNGRVNVLPPKYVIYWTIDRKKENCPDCIWLMDHGPWTKRTLPTTPRAGDTQCLFRCGCKLIMRLGSESRVRQIDRKWGNAKATLAKMRAGKRLVRKQTKR